MDNNIEFVVVYKNNQASLRNIKTEVEKLISSTKANIRIQPERGKTIKSTHKQPSKLESEYAKVAADAIKYEQKVADATARRNTNLNRIVELEGLSRQLTQEENNELKKLKNSKGGLTSLVNKSINAYGSLNSAMQILETKLQLAAGGFAALASLHPKKLTSFFEELEQRARLGVAAFNDMANSGRASEALSRAVDVMKNSILNDSKAFEDLGIKVKGNSQLFEIASRKLAVAIGRSVKPFELISERQEAPAIKGAGESTINLGSALKKPAESLILSVISFGDEASRAKQSLANIQFDKMRSAIDGLSVGSSELTGKIIGTAKELGKGSRFIVENSVVARGMAEVMLKYADSIRKSSSVDKPLTDAKLAQIQSIYRLVEMAGYLRRPTELLSKRQEELALAYGSVSRKVISSIPGNIFANSERELSEATSALRSAFKASGGDISKALLSIAQLKTPTTEGAKKLREWILVIDDDSKELKNLSVLKKYTKIALKEENNLSGYLSNAKRQEVGARGELIAQIKGEARISNKDAINRLNEALRDLVFTYRDAGKGYAKSGLTAKDLESATIQYSRELRNVVSKMEAAKGLESIGIDAKSIIDKALSQMMRKFEGQILSESSRKDKRAESSESKRIALEERDRVSTERLMASKAKHAKSLDMMNNAIQGKEVEKKFLELSVKELVSGRLNLAEVQRELVERFGRSRGDARSLTESVAKRAEDESIRIRAKQLEEGAIRDRANFNLNKIALDRQKKESELLSAIDDTIRAEKISARLRGRRPTGIGNVASGPQTVGVESGKADGLRAFAQKLNVKGHAQLVSILKDERGGFDAVSRSMKSHQGNIAKSNSLVERLTADMNSSSKAMFQFGFAAASAGERLLAWGSPALLIFRVIGALRTAVSDVIAIDEELRKIVFFSPVFLASIASGQSVLASALDSIGNKSKSVVDAFGELGTNTERVAVLTRAAADAQKILQSRSLETGLAVKTLAEMYLVAGRVGREAFSLKDRPFAQAVEQLVRLEGANANVTDITEKLNSIINQFNLESADATTIVALLAEISGRAALSASDLAEGVTRVAGAFNTLFATSPAETMEFLASASNTSQVSVSRLSTALRQFITGAVKNFDAIKSLSGIEIVSEDQIQGPEKLLDIFEQISKFKGRSAALKFITNFVDARNASVILSMATNTKKLREEMTKLKDPVYRIERLSSAITKSFAEEVFQSQSITSQFNKMGTALEKLVNESGAVQFMAKLVNFGTSIITVGNKISDVVGGVSVAFSVLAGLAIPALQKITKGFFSGLLSNQKFEESQRSIVKNLGKEMNLNEGIRLAQNEGLLSKSKANSLSSKAVDLEIRQYANAEKIKDIQKQKQVYDGKTLYGKRQIAQLQKQESLAIRESNSLESEHSKLVRSTRDELQNVGKARMFWGKYGSQIIGGMYSAALIAGPSLAKKLAETIGIELTSSVSSAIEGGVTGAVLGASFGPWGAAVGALASGMWSYFAAEQAASEEAQNQIDLHNRLAVAISRERLQIKQRAILEKTTRRNITELEEEILGIKSEVAQNDAYINKLGAEDLNRKLLEEKNAKLLERLSIKELQHVETKNKKEERALEIERAITALKQEQLLTSRALDVSLKGQLAVLEDSLDKPLKEVELKVRFDEQSIALERKALESELLRVSAEKLNFKIERDKEEEKKYENRQLELKNKLNELTLKDLENVLEASQSQISASKEVSNNYIDAFKKTGGVISEAFDRFISKQMRVVELIGQEIDIFNRLANISKEKVEFSSKKLNTGGIRQTLSIKNEAQVASDLTKIFNSNMVRVTKSLDKQLTAISGRETTESLSKSSQDISNRLKDLGGPLTELKTSLTQLQSEQFAQIEVDRNLFNQRKDATLKVIEVEKGVVNKKIELNSQYIDVIKRQIDAVGKLIEKEEELGEKLIKTPEEFLRETAKLFEVSNIFGNVDPRNIERDMSKIIGRTVSKSGVSGLQRILEGLEVAKERGVDVVGGGVSAEQVISLLKRQVYNPSAKIQDSLLSEQQILISKVESLYSEMENSNGNLLKILKEEENLNKLLADKDIDEKSLATLSSTLDSQRKTMRAAAMTATSVSVAQKNIIREIVVALESTTNKLDLSRGFDNISGGLSNIAKLIGVQLSSTPQIAENMYKGILSLRGTLNKLNTGDLSDDMKNAMNIELGDAMLEMEKENNELQRQLADLVIGNKRIYKLIAEQTGIDKTNERARRVLEGVASPSETLETMLLAVKDIPRALSGQYDKEGYFTLSEAEKKDLADYYESVSRINKAMDANVEEMRNTKSGFKEVYIAVQKARIIDILGATEETLRGASNTIGTSAGNAASAAAIESARKLTGSAAVSLGKNVGSSATESVGTAVASAVGPTVDKFNEYVSRIDSDTAAMKKQTEEMRDKMNLASSSVSNFANSTQAQTFVVDSGASKMLGAANNMSKNVANATTGVQDALNNISDSSNNSAKKMIKLSDLMSKKIKDFDSSTLTDAQKKIYEFATGTLNLQGDAAIQLVKSAKNLSEITGADVRSAYGRQTGIDPNMGGLSGELKSALSNLLTKQYFDRLENKSGAGAEVVDKINRQVLSMIKLLEGGKLDSPTIGELVKQISIAQTDSTFNKESFNKLYEDYRSGLKFIGGPSTDRLFGTQQNAQKVSDDNAKKVGDNISDSVKPVKSAVEGTNMRVEELKGEIVKMTNVLQKEFVDSRSLASKIAEEQMLQSIKKIEIDELSTQNFTNKVENTFNSVSDKIANDLSTTLNNNSVKLDLNKLEVDLKAEIKHVISGEDFTQQLVEKLLAAGFDNRQIASIQNTINKLVELERERGTPNMGSDWTWMSGTEGTR